MNLHNRQAVFDASKAHVLSRVTVRLNMLVDIGMGEKGLAWGSGFIFSTANLQYYLVTAWHNLAGRENETGKCKDPDLALPNFVELQGLYQKVRLPLYAGTNDPNADTPLYWRHPKGPQIDVAVLPLHGVQWQRAAALDHSFFDARTMNNIYLEVTQDCYVVGYPVGLANRQGNDAILPIWKHAMLAADPEYDFDGDPVYLIDATTRKGMSGSLVVAMELVGGTMRRRVLGVYGGRLLGHEKDDTNLGFVYMRDTITEIIKAGPNSNPPVFRNKVWEP